MKKKLFHLMDQVQERYPRLAHVLFTDDLRTDASLALSSVISLLFTLFCILSGLAHDARWFITLGTYHLVICLVRFYTALELRREIRHPGQKSSEREIQICLRIGRVLLFVNLIFIGIMAETIIRNNALHYHPFLLVLLCLFCLSRFALHFTLAMRHRHEGVSLDQAIRMLNITIALCSLYTTQTAVLAQVCTDEIVRLCLNLAASSVIFYFLLRLAVRTVTQAREALES